MKEAIEGLNILPDGVYIDATLGGAGHSLEILQRLDKSGLLIGVDQDEFAIRRAESVLAEHSNIVRIVKANFSSVDEVLGAAKCRPCGNRLVDGVLMDLGVSSFQLDDADRGFSYMHDGRLDMRMNQDNNFSAYDVVNEYSEARLKKIFHEYGEEKWSARIAQFIVSQRQIAPIYSSFELVSVIKAAIPKAARKDGPHPAKRVFQAIRIEVNDELGILECAIKNYVKALSTGGRICIITFHSLEDRIVKNTFAKLKSPCDCPREIPICVCKKVPVVDIITKKPIMPTDAELESNPRARSAKLRIAQKI